MRAQRKGATDIVDPLPAMLAGRWNRSRAARLRRSVPECVVVRHRFGGRSARKE